MADKPDFRQLDSVPSRGDDVDVQLPVFKYHGSGRLLVAILIAIAMLVGSIGGGIIVLYHEKESISREKEQVTANERAHTQIVQAISRQTEVIKDQTFATDLQTCVNTLDQMEKKEFRLGGRYCNGKVRLEAQGVLR